MTMICRFINTTTRLPVDTAIEESFFRTVKPAFLEAYLLNWTPKQTAFVDVYFVNKDDFDLERKRCQAIEDGRTEPGAENEPPTIPADHIPNMDLLGVYFPHHPDHHRPVIKVSPEKIMDACRLLKTKQGISPPLATLYPTILIAVIIHELAHACMDEEASSHSHCDIPWNWLAHRLDEEDSRYDDYYDRGFFCHHHFDSRRTIDPKLLQWRHLIEESLANAFVLKQGFKADQLKAIKMFIKSQPSGYNAGVLWQSNLTKLLQTANSWRSSKRDYFYPHSRWSLITNESGIQSPLELLVGRLNSGKIIGSYDFENEFDCHLINRLPVWQLKFQQDKTKWDDFLNGTFGVLWRLAHHHGQVSDPKLKYLRQWAKNGSPDGVNELNKALSDLHEAKGNYKKALMYQNKRLINLPKMKHNDYWHDQYHVEIQNKIDHLQAEEKFQKQ